MGATTRCARRSSAAPSWYGTFSVAPNASDFKVTYNGEFEPDVHAVARRSTGGRPAAGFRRDRRSPSAPRAVTVTDAAPSASIPAADLQSRRSGARPRLLLGRCSRSRPTRSAATCCSSPTARSVLGPQSRHVLRGTSPAKRSRSTRSTGNIGEKSSADRASGGWCRGGPRLRARTPRRASRLVRNGTPLADSAPSRRAAAGPNTTARRTARAISSHACSNSGCSSGAAWTAPASRRPRRRRSARRSAADSQRASPTPSRGWRQDRRRRRGRRRSFPPRRSGRAGAGGAQAVGERARAVLPLRARR